MRWVAVMIMLGAVPALAQSFGVTSAKDQNAQFVPKIRTGATGAANTASLSATMTAISTVGGGVVQLPPGTYNVAGTITLPSNVTLRGPATLVQTSANTPTIKADTKTDIVVEDLTLTGYGPTDVATTVNSAFWDRDATNKAHAIWCLDCSRVSVRRVTMTNHRGSGILLWKPTDAWVEDNRITGTYDGGVVETGLPPANASYSQFGVLIQADGTGDPIVGDHIIIAKNKIDKVAHAVFVAPGFTNVTVDDNRWWDLQQHGFYIYPTTGVIVTKNKGHSLTGCKVQSTPSNTHFTPSDITISGNILSSTSAPALGVEFTDEYSGSTPVRAANFISNALITKNQLSSTSHAGLLLSGLRDVRVVGNVVRNTARSGIYSWAASGVIEGNTLIECGNTGYDPISINASPYLTMRVGGNEIVRTGGGTPSAYMTAVWSGTLSPPIAWAGSKYHGRGAYVANGAEIYKATVGGVSAASVGPTGTGAGITDGAATWDWVTSLTSVDHGTTIFEANVVTTAASEPTYAMYLNGTSAVLRGNRIQGTSKFIYTNAMVSLEDDGANVHNGWNAGAPYAAGPVPGRPRREFMGNAAPVAGTWQVGDRVWNTAPSAGGTAFWTCTTGGTPGTWKATVIAP